MRIKQAVLIAVMGLIALLSISCGGGTPAAPSDPLAGTSWELIAYGKTSPIPGTTITASFEDGQVRGRAGCNSFSGSYQISGDTITMGALAITEMACLDPEGVMEQEQIVMGFLQDAQTFRLTGGQLEILRSDGEALTFVPQG
jgi:heat shock protein HslJ